MEIREQYDADRFGGRERASTYKTAEFPYPAICEMCARTWYVTEGMHESISRAIEEGLDNPFLCDDCREEYEELNAYEQPG